MVFARIARLQILAAIANIISDSETLIDHRLELGDDMCLLVQNVCVAVWVVACVTR